ncbi:MarR family transcriptional regulator [Komagataeibacter rhaeticus]|nr:MarR family transcriptional regulator [Komagataeibacter rhaeticus]
MDYDLDRQIGYLLRRAYQRHTTIFQHEIPDDRLTSAQFATMITIHRLEAAPLVQISAMAGIDHATLRDIVTRLRKRGCLTSFRTVRTEDSVSSRLRQKGACWLKIRFPVQSRSRNAHWPRWICVNGSPHCIF